MYSAFVGRQPIFDRDLGLHAYELLFRSGEENCARVVDGNRATSQLIMNAFMEIGLERIVAQYPAFINCPKAFLLEGCFLPKERVVLEVLEDVVIDRAVIDAVRGLSESGFVIALDDFIYEPSWEPLIALADIIKVDVRALDEAEIADYVARLRPRGVKLLAEKVETQEEFGRLKAMGFDYFQGYFLCKPNVVRGRRIPENRLATLTLLGRLSDPHITFDEIDALVSQDVSLSYKLFRYLNSAAFNLGSRIESIRRAVVYFGIDALKRWASLIAMAGNEDKPLELMRIALLRAKMCELLCKTAGRPGPETYFTVGLFSALDALMDTPMEEILERLPLATEISSALLERRGSLGAALRCALAYEACDWPEVAFAGLDATPISEAYAEAASWTFKASATIR